MQRMVSLVQLGVGLEGCARWWCVALLLECYVEDDSPTLNLNVTFQ
jgi:hypothetical protein